MTLQAALIDLAQSQDAKYAPRAAGASRGLVTGVDPDNRQVIVQPDGSTAQLPMPYVGAMPAVDDIVALEWVGDGNPLVLGALAGGPATTAYTPAWTSTGTQPAIGDGTLAGQYLRVGRLVVAHVRCVAGSTTTFGTGDYSWGLPFAAAWDGNCTWGGWPAACENAGINRYFGFAFLGAAGAFTVQNASGSLTMWGPTVPFAFGSGDLVVSATLAYTT